MPISPLGIRAVALWSWPKAPVARRELAAARRIAVGAPTETPLRG